MDAFLDVFDVLLDVLYFGFVYLLIGVLALGGLLTYFGLTKLEEARVSKDDGTLIVGITDMAVGITFVIVSFILLKDRTGAAEWLQRLLP